MQPFTVTLVLTLILPKQEQMKPIPLSLIAILSLAFSSQIKAQECGLEAVATLTTELWADEISYTISDDNGMLIEGQGVSDYNTSSASFCLDNLTGCLVLEMFDDFGDGWNGGVLTISIPALEIPLGTFTLDYGSHEVVIFGEGCENTSGDFPGCTDPSAFNFDPYANVDDGSCVYECICEDIYEPVCAFDYLTGEYLTFPNECEAMCAGAWVALIGDCSDLPVYGCTDVEALNYNENANTDDGSCLYPCECDDVYEPVCAYDYLSGDYVTFNNLCEAECWNAWIVWDGDCSEQPIYGCTDAEAINYNPEATDDDGSCIEIPVCADNESSLVVEVLSSDSLIELGLGGSLFWSLTTDLGAYVDLAYDYNDYQQATAYGCLADGCYNFFVYDYGWAPGTGSVSVTIAGETTNYSVPEFEYEAAFAIGVNVEGCEVTIPGCTDESALNYHPTATVDDGSCQYPFECEEGTPGQLYICTFSGGQNVGLNITADNGEVLFSQEGFDDLAIVYLDVCLQDSTCYTATLADLSGEGLGWNGGYFWVSTGFADLIHAELPPGTPELQLEFSIDGTCGEIINPSVYGCTDPAAINFHPEATINDGSCQYNSLCENGVEAYVYMFATASDFGLDIVTDSGDLVYSQEGWADTGDMFGQFCLEYNTCYTAVISGFNGDSLGWNEGFLSIGTNFAELVFAEWPIEQDTWELQFSVDGSCGEDSSVDVYGCTDPFATNYNPYALVDDGSCIYENLCEGLFEVLFVLDGGAMPDELTLKVFNDIGHLLMEMDGYTGSSFGCVPAGCYTVEMMDSNGDGWNGAFAELFVNGESSGTMTLEDGSYELRNIGIGQVCETLDNEEGSSSNVNDANLGFDDAQAFPNPGNDRLNIRWDGWNSSEPLMVEVYNAEGRRLNQLFDVNFTSGHTWTMNASSLDAGIYIIHASQKGVTQQIQWIKLR